MADAAAPGTTGPTLHVGKVLARSFTILFRNVVPFGFLALLFTAPSFIIALSAGPQTEPVDEVTADLVIRGGAVFFVDLLLGSLLTVVLIYGTIQTLRGQPVGIGASLSRGAALFVPALGVVIVYSLALLVGFTLLVIPGIVVIVFFWVVLPVAVIEQPGVFASFSRSRVLTKGNRWRIFALFVILIAVSFIGGFIIGFVIGFVFGFTESFIEGSGALSAPTIDWVTSAFASALWAIASAVSYHDLRVAKEGVDVDELAAVFD